MVLESECGSDPGTGFGCLICLTSVPHEKKLCRNKKIKNEVGGKTKNPESEELSSLFEIVCKHMQWTPGSKYRFNFDSEEFPFCRDCQRSIVELKIWNQFLENAQKEISHVTSKLSAKVLESQSWGNAEHGNLCSKGSKKRIPKTGEKANYYRDLICKRYATSVRLILDPGLLDAQRKSIHENGRLKELSVNGKSERRKSERRSCSGERMKKRRHETAELKFGGGILKDAFDEEDVSGSFASAQEEEDSDQKSVSSEVGALTDEGSEGGGQGGDLTSDGNDSSSGGSSLDGNRNDACFKEKKGLKGRVRSGGNQKLKRGTDVLSRLARTCKGGTTRPPCTLQGDVLKCDSCSAVFLTISGLNTHFRKTHKNPESVESIYEDEGSKSSLKDVGPSFDSIGKNEPASANTSDGTELRTDGFNLDESSSLTTLNEKMGPSADDEDKNEHLNEDDTQPFPSLQDRVRKVGDSKFLLDEKCLFGLSNNQWKCFSCDVTFPRTGKLREHLIYSCPGGPLDDVARTFKYKRYFVYDRLISGDLRCRHCNYLCSIDSHIIAHIRECHVGKYDYKSRNKPWYIEVEPNKYLCNQKFPFEFASEKFICSTCFATFPVISEVVSHIQEEHLIPATKNKIWYKEVSEGKFAWTDSFNTTYSFEKMDNVFKCGECLYSNPKLDSIKFHIKQRHINSSKLVCKICGKRYSCGSNLARHRKEHASSPGLRPFVCELCGKSFRTPDLLKCHQALMHPELAENKFTCEICGRLLGSKGLYTSHMRAHEYVVCHVCGKEVRNGNKLSQHMLTHREDTYECPKCDKKFRYSVSLRLHLKTHDGVRPHSCDLCGLTFIHEFLLNRHTAVVHDPNRTTKPRKPRKKYLANLAVEKAPEDTESRTIMPSEFLEVPARQTENSGSVNDSVSGEFILP